MEGMNMNPELSFTRPTRAWPPDLDRMMPGSATRFSTGLTELKKTINGMTQKALTKHSILNPVNCLPLEHIKVLCT
jgi:hypothetical protein